MRVPCPRAEGVWSVGVAGSGKAPVRRIIGRSLQGGAIEIAATSTRSPPSRTTGCRSAATRRRATRPGAAAAGPHPAASRRSLSQTAGEGRGSLRSRLVRRARRCSSLRRLRSDRAPPTCGGTTASSPRRRTSCRGCSEFIRPASPGPSPASRNAASPRVRSVGRGGSVMRGRGPQGLRLRSSAGGCSFAGPMMSSGCGTRGWPGNTGRPGSSGVGSTNCGSATTSGQLGSGTNFSAK
jgi:hypothetical protein